uniref:Uncharacterized protein n=1 Tax=Sparus aurata TaxID=8175 RepID=A0A671Z2F3_SPAAU
MSLSNVPSQVDVMGWNPQNLADYMKRLKLSGCDKAVMKAGITGAQFMVSVSKPVVAFALICYSEIFRQMYLLCIYYISY